MPTPWSIPPPPPILQPSSGSDQDVGLHAEGTSTSGSYNPVKSELSASTSEGSNTYGVEYITSAGYVPHNTVASNFAGFAVEPGDSDAYGFFQAEQVKYAAS